MYSIAYQRHGFPIVDLTFQTERELEIYANIWIDGDEDWVVYFKDNVEYTPSWAL